MRKRFRVLLLATIVASVAVPVGFALSLENDPVVTHSTTIVATTSAGVVAPALVPMRSSSFAEHLAPLSDGARLAVVGTLLFGLAAMVRRAA